MGIDKMLSFEEWEKLVIDSKKGNDISKKILLEESHPIIDSAVRTELGTEDDVSLDDIYQEVCLRVHTNLAALKNPKAYPNWLKRITQNYCKDLKKRKKYLIQNIDDLNSLGRRKSSRDFDSIADRRGLESDAFTLYHDQINGLVSKEYKIETKQKSDEITNTVNSLKTKKRKSKITDRRISVLSNILAKSLIDKKEYDYVEAEKKLRTMILHLEERRLIKELRYFLASAITEIGHLKMNEGTVTGNDSSIYWYKRAEKLWRSINDKSMELFVRPQLGVSQHIKGDDLKAAKAYNSILSEIGRKRTHRAFKADVYRDQSNALLAMDEIGESNQQAEKSLRIAEDVGGITLSYTKLQLAKIYIKKKRYNQAHALINSCLEDTPLFRVLDHIKAKIALLDLFIMTDEKNEALKLIPGIRNNCTEYRFYHQLQKLHSRLLKL
jgi:DNA-directed RNA polymerase specialized sigma24 family protein